VWIAFTEEPGTATLVGGLVVIAAVLIQAGGERRRREPDRGELPPR
jgi:hypothetical protein